MERKIKMKKQELINAIGTVNLDDKAKNRILKRTLSQAHKKECGKMSKKKICAIAAAAAVFAIGIVAYAANGIITSWEGSSSAIPEYNSLPAAHQLAKDIGYEPKIPESFKNGYSFENARIVNNRLKDDSNISVEKFKSVAADYKKGANTVMLSVDKFNSYVDLSGDITININGTELYYTSYTNKIVPPDYRLTDEDIKAEENGELVFSYGSDRVYISQVQGLTWKQDGMQYNFTQIDGELSSDELIEMAAEIINK